MSSLGLTTTVMATWEAFTVVFVTVLTNGGPVALVYGFIFCFIGTMATCASLAEYASMYVARPPRCLNCQLTSVQVANFSGAVS